MYHMGNFHSIQKKIRFEDIQIFKYQQSDSYMINTMSSELRMLSDKVLYTPIKKRM